MNSKKILSLLICFFIAAPALSDIIYHQALAKSYANSGIAQYYMLFSNTVYTMVNAVLKIYKCQTAKKESPAKQEEQKNKNCEAVILNNCQKSLETVQPNFSELPSFISSSVLFQILFEGISKNSLFQGWFLLLLSALLMCVRKKYANIAPVQFKYFIKCNARRFYKSGVFLFPLKDCSYLLCVLARF
jgi:hypothetical protein